MFISKINFLLVVVVEVKNVEVGLSLVLVEIVVEIWVLVSDLIVLDFDVTIEVIAAVVVVVVEQTVAFLLI